MSSSEEPSLTLTEFCRLERVSKSWLYEQLRLGLGPEITELGPRVRRITPKARAEWHDRMAELAKSETAQLEAARRREFAAVAGRAAAASALHASRRRARSTATLRRRGR